MNIIKKMEQIHKSIDTNTLRDLLDKGSDVLVLDIRPIEQREEWQIPGSTYLNAYKRLNEGDLSVLDEVQIPKNTKVVTVCAAGRTSQIASDALREKGIDAYSLEGGMKSWTSAWNTAIISDEKATIIQVRRTGKGCLSYIVGSEGEAIVIDASLDVEIYQALAAQHGWKIKYAMDTHIHADHLSRSFRLAETTEAELFMPQQNKLKYSFTSLNSSTVLKFGSSILKAIPTPGHTLESFTYLLDQTYLFTGDTLFTDGVGRPDLKASEEEAKNRAGLLYDSLMNLIHFPEATLIFPGHISKPVPFDGKPIAATITEVKAQVSALSLSKEYFTTTILSKIPATPPNYLKVVEMNLVADIDSINPEEVEAGANRCAIS